MPPERTKDRAWLPIAGAEDWVVILRDKKIRTRPGERRALIEAGVRAFCLTGAGSYTRWQTLELLVNRWPMIEDHARMSPGPYIRSVTKSGVRDLFLKGAPG